jgi:hypothetical protein
MSKSDRIADALFECVRNAPHEEQAELFAALEDFRTTYFRSYHGVIKQPFAAKLVRAIEEAERFAKEMQGD